MPTTYSLHAAVVLSFAEDKWCVASFRWTEKPVFCNYRSDLALWCYAIFCTHVGSFFKVVSQSDNQSKERWSGHKERKWGIHKEKGSEIVSETSEQHWFSQTRQKSRSCEPWILFIVNLICHSVTWANPNLTFCCPLTQTLYLCYGFHR